MENKRHVVEAVAFAILLTCAIVIWFNVSLKAERKAEQKPFQGFKSIEVSTPPRNTIEWEDKFDSIYIEPITGCLFLTHKA
jgi:hypothetical protein